MKRDSDTGLTIIEVLIALVIFAVGVMALAQLQTSSLRFSSQAEQLRTATQIAEGEIEWRRQTAITVGANPCDSYTPEGFTCSVTIIPCNASGDGLTCAAGLVAPVAYEITVAVTGPRIEEFSLRTVTTGTFVSGVLADGSVDPIPPGDEPDPGDGGDEPDPPPIEDPEPCRTKGKSKVCR